MPRTGQIIPEYLQPHVATYINDNTEFQEVVAGATDGVRSIHVFTSGQGRDGVLLPFTSPSDYTDEYGNPNYKLYGQPGYMPYAALSSLQAKAWCMRVMPDDATYSNVIILAKVKVDKTDASNPKLVIQHTALYHTGLKNKDEFNALTDALKKVDPDTDGFRVFPIIGTFCLGRGVYGDMFRVRVSASPQADKDNGYKNYTFEVLSSQNGLKRKELFVGSLYSDALYGQSSVFLEDVVNDTDSGSSRLGIYVCEDSIQDILDIYKTEVDPATTFDVGTFDILTGKTLSAQAIANIVIDNTSTGTIAIDNAAGTTLAGGDDGSFSSSTASDVRESAINEAYIKAFSGDMDRAILSKRRAPAELIYDANYEASVKRALIALILKRYDAFGFIDAGILNNASDAMSWSESMANLGDRIFSKECQHYKIRDPFTGKAIPMTVTYFFAQQLPLHFKQTGNQVPFVGETVAKLSGAMKNSLKPVIDADDMDIKEKLYTNRVNYFECTAENTFVRGVQGTSQMIWSDLSEENNMHVLLEMKRELETLVGSLNYNFAEPEDRQRFTERAERLFSGYQGSKVKTATVYFDMNQWETERSILHCYLAVTYRTLAKRGIIEIDINKRS